MSKIYIAMVSLLGAYAFRPRASSIGSFDHLVGAGDQGRRESNAKGLGGFEVEGQFDFRRLLNRQLCGLCTLQDFIHVDCCTTVLVRDVGSIAHEPAVFDMLAITINRLQTCSCREVGNLPTSRIKGCVGRDEQRFNVLPAKHRERRVNLVGAANLYWHEQNAARLGSDFRSEEHTSE